MRTLHLFVAVRQAREATERLLELQGWPAASPLHRAIDALVPPYAEPIRRAAAARAAL